MFGSTVGFPVQLRFLPGAFIHALLSRVTFAFARLSCVNCGHKTASVKDTSVQCYLVNHNVKCDYRSCDVQVSIGAARALIFKQEQQRVAVRPGNARVISICQVSSNAATLRRCTCGSPPLPLLLLLLCIANLLIKN